jgi:DNA-binding NtrC family response regulator
MTHHTHRAHLLVVEDDPVQARLYHQAFPGCRITWVRTGSAALVAVQERAPDLILLDHVLDRGESGLQFLPRLKEHAAHVPVIVISGTLAVGDQIRALSGPRSAHYVIEKPVDLEVLEETIETALRECGLGEAVASLRSLERAELIESGERERRFTERLARQHSLVNLLRDPSQRANLTQLAEKFGVDRRSIRRDLQDLIARGQLAPGVLGLEADTP